MSPCVLPLVVPYLAYVGGTAVEDARGAIGRGALLNAGAFVLGFVTMFVIFGAAAGALGDFLADHRAIASAVAGSILVLVGLHLGRMVRVPWLDRDTRISSLARPTGPLGAYVVGLAFAFGWSPCIGPILAAILTLAAARESVAYGTALLAVYGVAMALPFMVAAAFAGPFVRVADRLHAHGRIIERVTAALVIVTGVLIMTGSFWHIGLWMLRALPFFRRFG